MRMPNDGNTSTARTIDDFRAWMIDRELSKATINSYTFTMRDFFSRYDEVNHQNILRYKAALIEEGKSPKTVNIRIGAIAQWCKMSGIECRVKKLKIQKMFSVENVITEAEYTHLLKALASEENWQWYWNVRLLATTGARVSELVRITKADFDRGTSEMWTKGKIRRIYIPKAFRDEANEFYSALSDKDNLVRGRCGTVTREGVAQALRRFAGKYGIDKSHMHPHAFRHRFAINFLKKNPNLTLLADVMGHSNISTTAIYTRLTQEEQIKQIDETIDW